VARPKGIPQAHHFAIREEEVPKLTEGEFLIRNTYWSVDPAMRGWANEGPNYLPPTPLGEPMRAFAVGKIVASRNEEHTVGDIVTGMFGWNRYTVSDGSTVERTVLDHDLPHSYALGVLGMSGFTAYFGLLEHCKPLAGETVVVSAAAGGVGSLVGQIARLHGCRTIGIAGGAAKVAQCLADGYDAAIDYKTALDDGTLTEQVRDACRGQMDCYFVNYHAQSSNPEY
jgi:NADPH-dependent curcumin reductase CurA